MYKLGLKNRTCITDFDVDMILPLIYKKKYYMQELFN